MKFITSEWLKSADDDRLLASVFLNAPFWGQNDAVKTQNDPNLRLFLYDYSVLARTIPKEH